jgi:hypothetical protein
VLVSKNPWKPGAVDAQLSQQARNYALARNRINSGAPNPCAAAPIKKARHPQQANDALFNA